jgi:hypothetical protein
MPDAATFLMVQTFAIQFAQSNVSTLLLIGAAAAARLA